MSDGPFLYPSVTSLPSSPSQGTSPADRAKKQPGVKGEFDHVFEKALQGDSQTDLNQVRTPLKMSAHATQRLQDRKIALDSATMSKINDAIDKAAAKGVEDTLVLTDKAALIVSVKNRTVITALDRGSLSGNVFTNIDGAVII